MVVLMIPRVCIKPKALTVIDYQTFLSGHQIHYSKNKIRTTQLSCFQITAFFQAMCRLGENADNFKMLNFFNSQESFLYCLFSK